MGTDGITVSKLDRYKAIEQTVAEIRRGDRQAMVPKSFKVWESELRGVQSLILRLVDQEDDMGSVWVNKMRTHYTKRYNQLIKNPPKLPKGYKLPKTL